MATTERGDVVRWVTIRGRRIPITAPRGRALRALLYEQRQPAAVYQRPVPVVVDPEDAAALSPDQLQRLVRRVHAAYDEVARLAREIVPPSLEPLQAIVLGPWPSPDEETRRKLQDYAGFYSPSGRSIHISAAKARAWSDEWLREVLAHELGHHVADHLRREDGVVLQNSQELRGVVARALAAKLRYAHAEHQQRRKGEGAGEAPDDPLGSYAVSEWAAELFALCTAVRRHIGLWPDEIAELVRQSKRPGGLPEELHAAARRAAEALGLQGRDVTSFTGAFWLGVELGTAVTELLGRSSISGPGIYLDEALQVLADYTALLRRLAREHEGWARQQRLAERYEDPQAREAEAVWRAVLTSVRNLLAEEANERWSSIRRVLGGLLETAQRYSDRVPASAVRMLRAWATGRAVARAVQPMTAALPGQVDKALAAAERRLDELLDAIDHLADTVRQVEGMNDYWRVQDDREFVAHQLADLRRALREAAGTLEFEEEFIERECGYDPDELRRIVRWHRRRRKQQ